MKRENGQLKRDERTLRNEVELINKDNLEWRQKSDLMKREIEQLDSDNRGLSAELTRLMEIEKQMDYYKEQLKVMREQQEDISVINSLRKDLEMKQRVMSEQIQQKDKSLEQLYREKEIFSNENQQMKKEMQKKEKQMTEVNESD